MSVVVESFQEPLADVFVDEGVVRDLVAPLLELGLVRKLVVEKQVSHLEVGRGLGELLDGITAVAEDALVPVDEGDGALARGCSREARVVEPDTWKQLLPLGRRYAPELDRNLELVAGPVVDDRDALWHET